MKRGIPFSIELPSGIETLDTMTDEEFDKMMQTGLEQAKRENQFLLTGLWKSFDNHGKNNIT